MTKRIYISLLCGLLWASAMCLAGDANADLRIVSISRLGSEVQVVYDFPLQKPQADYQVTLQPALVSHADTLLLEPIVLNGWNNIRQLHRDHELNHKNEPEQDYYPQRLRRSVLRDTLMLPVSEYRWLLNKDVCVCSMKQVKEGCCRVIEQDDECSHNYHYEDPMVAGLDSALSNPTRRLLTVVPLSTVVTTLHSPVLVPVERYVPFTDKQLLERDTAALYVYFDIDSTRIDRDYRANRHTLDSICYVISSLMQDERASVEKIQVVGVASIEARESYNKQLAGKRAVALKEYIQANVPYQLADSMFNVGNGGEAWADFRWQVEQCHQSWRDDVLQLIDTVADVAVREWKIRYLAGGKPYEWIRDNLLGEQRHSGYIRVFYSLAKDNNGQIINNAIALLENHEYAKAEELLLTVKDDERALFPLGVALYMNGNEAEAEMLWEQAAALGNVEAQRTLEELRIQN